MHTFAASRQPEGGKRANDAKDILRVNGRDLALGWVGSVDGQLGARRGDNLLLLGSGKLAQNRLSDGRRGLDGQGIHKHVRRGRHGGQLQSVLVTQTRGDATRRVLWENQI